MSGIQSPSFNLFTLEQAFLPVSHTRSPFEHRRADLIQLYECKVFQERSARPSELLQHRFIRACRMGDLRLTRYFLCTNKYSTKILNLSLFEATKSGNKEVLTELLQNRVASKDITLVGIDLALEYNQIETFKIWVSLISPEDPDLRELLFYFSNSGDLEFFNLVLERGDFLSKTLKDVASVSIRFGNINILKSIVCRGLPVDYLGELFFEASIQNELEMIKFLGEQKIPEKFLEKAFLESVSSNLLEIAKHIMLHGIRPHIIKEGLIRSIHKGYQDLANFCLLIEFAREDIDEALLIACERGQKEIMLKLLEREPTSLGLLSALQISAIEGHVDIFFHLISFVEYSIDMLLEVRQIALSSNKFEIVDLLERFIYYNYPAYFGVNIPWSVDLEDLRDDPSLILDSWLEMEVKPHEISFKGQDGFGEGLTRQFYAELAQSLFKKILDEKGVLLPKNPHNIDLEGVAILLSYMLKHNFTSGKLFTNSFKQILLLVHDRLTPPSLAVEEIHYITDLDSFPVRAHAWAFVVDPQDEEAKNRWLSIFEQEFELKGIQDATLKEQIEATENYLITKHSKNILKEFLHQVRTQGPVVKKSKQLVQRIAQEFFFEDIKTLPELIEFACEWELGALKDAESIYHDANLFLKGLNPMLIQMLYRNNFEALEGTPLQELKSLNLKYLGQDLAILKKIDLIQDLIAEKIRSKEIAWIEKLLFFITGSRAYPKDLVIGVSELSEESFPEARTCFKQLRLSKGFDTKPAELKDWETRFLSKLEFAISETGYQKD